MLAHSATSSDSCSQITLYGLAAVMSGICCGLQRRLLLWRRRGWEVVGDRIWEHLGTYSGWMCAGCAAGAVAFAIRMHSEIFHFESGYGIQDRQKYDLLASQDRHDAAFNVFYPLELLCVIFAMNMLLRRVSDHASHR